MRILIVEDDAPLARSLKAALKASGITVDHEANGTDAARLALSEPFALVILDIGLPGTSGFEVLRRIRAAGSAMPILMLTARGDIADRVKGLDLGADDYLTKPFALAELEARVRALLRRGSGLVAPILECDGLTLDRSSSATTLGGVPLLLRPRELALLTALMTRLGKVVMKERLSAEIFGFDEVVSPNALEIYVARLRKKLVGGPEIQTLRGLGYMMIAR